MNDLSKDTKEKIYKCSKCGLCRSVCPVFLSTANEMFLPRGRFIVLNNHINNSVNLSKSFIKKLDICLNCNLCKDFCPSNIDSYKIFTEIKSKYGQKKTLIPFSVKLKFIFFLEKIKALKNGTTIKRRKTSKKQNSNIAFFEGCYNKFVNGNDKNAVLNILEEAGFNVDVISSCCGYPYLSEANINKFKKNASKVLENDFSKYEYIICSCDTCFDTLNRYKEYIPEAETFTNKLLRFDEFIKIKNISFPITKNVSYFKPLLRKSDFFLKPMNKKGMCSGLENFFVYKYPKLSDLLLKPFKSTDDELKNGNIITTCLLTKLGLQKIREKSGFTRNIYTLSEYMELNGKN